MKKGRVRSQNYPRSKKSGLQKLENPDRPPRNKREGYSERLSRRMTQSYPGK